MPRSYGSSQRSRRGVGGIPHFPALVRRELRQCRPECRRRVTLSIKGDLLDYSYNLQNFHDGPVNMVATISTGLARMVVYALLALAFSEMAALCKDLTVWLADGRDATLSKAWHRPVETGLAGI